MNIGPPAARLDSGAARARCAARCSESRVGRRVRPPEETIMNRFHTLLVAATLLAAPSALADAPAPVAAGDDCTMTCCEPIGDCCDVPCDVPCE
jgi:hypothetical protein